jgi:hypothetical protein
VSVICRNGPVFAVRSGMMNGTRLREPVAQQWERFLEPDREGVVVATGHLVERGGERLAQGVAYRPAPQRRHAISAAHRDLKVGYGWK